MRPSTLATSLVTVLASVALTSADSAAAPVRCTLPGGRVLYQEPPCPPGAGTREVDGTVALGVEPPTVQRSEPPPSDRGKRSRARAKEPTRAASTRSASTDRPRAASAPSEPREKVRRSQALASERRFLRAGMTEAEVLASVGEPDMVSRAPRGVGRSARRSDTWVYSPAPGDPQTTTTLVFRDGAVTEVRRIVGR